MPMFICLKKDKWVMARCGDCHDDCELAHPVTQETGTRLYGAGFDQRKPAVGKPLSPLGAEPLEIKPE